MTITVIGTGLIGGSLAVTLKKLNFCKEVIGVDLNSEHVKTALKLNLIDKIADLKEGVESANIVIIAVPVDASIKILERVLDLTTHQVVMDTGSTKESVIKIAVSHKNRKRFVATHPIWGTEYRGPEAAVSGGFEGKVTVICNPEESDPDALKKVEALYACLKMNIIYMDSTSHDLHAAYVSHISHITSFALALSVLEKEKEEDTIFQLAGAGFESTVRLAKSNPDMWIPIFRQNRSNILDVLNEQIYQLKQIKKLMELEEFDALYKLIEQANQIKRIIK